MAPENNPWKRRFLLETIIFRCYVSFRECNSFWKRVMPPFPSHFLSVATWVGYWYLVTALFHPTNIAMDYPHIVNRNIFSIGNTSSEGPISILMLVYQSVSRYFVRPVSRWYIQQLTWIDRESITLTARHTSQGGPPTDRKNGVKKFDPYKRPRIFWGGTWWWFFHPRWCY